MDLVQLFHTFFINTTDFNLSVNSPVENLKSLLEDRRRKSESS